MDFSIAVKWFVACCGFLLLAGNALVYGASSKGTLAMMKQKSLAHHSRKVVLSSSNNKQAVRPSKWRTEYVLNSAAAPIDTQPTEQTQDTHTDHEEALTQSTTVTTPSVEVPASTQKPSSSSAASSHQQETKIFFPGFENLRYDLDTQRKQHQSVTLLKSNGKTNASVNKQQTHKDKMDTQKTEESLVPSSESEAAAANQKKEDSETKGGTAAAKNSHVWLMPDEDLLKALTEAEAP